ncbi:hypothetical protein EGW08_022057, partial [Elysia chlorotica]
MSVCDPSSYGTYTGPPLPVLPDSVTWRVEVNVVGGGNDFTQDFHQFIDYSSNRHALHYWKDGQMFWAIFKYTSNEQIMITFPKGGTTSTESATCQISPLDQSMFAKLFGDTTVNGRPHTPRPLDALRLSKYYPLKYLGKMDLTSGVKAIAWESCQSNDTTGYTQKV